MTLLATKWNVVLAGHWNLAILSPGWISEILFQIPQGEQMEVMVPIDGISPIQVKHADIVIAPTITHVAIEAASPSLESLEKCVAIGKRIVEELPKTPIHGIGINFRYSISEIDSTALVWRLFDSEIDNVISALLLKTVSSSVTRKVEHKTGVLNFTLDFQNGAFSALFNFEQKEKSAVEKMKAWLCEGIQEMETLSNQILAKLFEPS